MIRTLLPIALFAALAACGSENQANENEATAAFAGNWSQEGGGMYGGITLEIDGDSKKVHVHTAPDETGAHDHLNGTYEVDADAGSISISCNLGGSGDNEVWKGKIENDHLMLTLGEKTLKFHKGGSGHDHDHGHGDHEGGDHDHEGHDHDKDHDEHK